jgi:hypothetical protein
LVVTKTNPELEPHHASDLGEVRRSEAKQQSSGVGAARDEAAIPGGRGELGIVMHGIVIAGHVCVGGDDGGGESELGRKTLSGTDFHESLSFVFRALFFVRRVETFLLPARIAFGREWRG